MITRRRVIRGMAGMVLAGVASAGYGFGVEPFRLVVTRYRLVPPGWPTGLKLRIAALADLHACEPWVSVPRIRSIVQQTNALAPDLTVLLGDYTMGHHWITGQVHSRDWAAALGGLRAPLGVHAVMGNHDWWDDRTAQVQGHGPTFGHRALARNGIGVLANRALRLRHGDHAVWLAGLEDQLALLPHRRYGRTRWRGLDDLTGTLAQVTDDAPVILLAHEPDIFPQVPARVALTLSGHTHGGQVRLFGHSPVVPSRFGNRYAYGLVTEPDTAGGSIMPVRFGVPPEVVLIDLG